MKMGWLLLSPLRVLINGEAAVITFFVLSGFVLALPYFGATPPNYGGFVVKRICRICIPYYVALILAVIVYLAQGVTSMSDPGIWEPTIWDPDPSLTVTLFVRHLFCFVLGVYTDTGLDAPAWSLIPEMRVSIIFPLLVMLVRRPKLGVPITIGLYGAGLWLSKAYGQFFIFPFAPNNILSSYFMTVYFLPCFIVGIMLAAHRDAILTRMVNLPDIIILLLWLVVFGSFCYVGPYEIMQPMAIGASALLVVLVQTTGIAVRILQTGVFQWLGRISYSLFLVHVPLIYLVAHQWGGNISPYVAVVGIITLSLFVATIMERYVEVPAISLGRRLTRK